MAKTAFVGTRVDPALKLEVERICADLGLSLSQAITLFLKQMQYHQGLPFQVRIPGPETKAAIDQARNRDTLASHNPDSLLEDLGL